MSDKEYRDWDPDQQYLVPPSRDDWLPEDHKVYLILDVLEQLDISSIEAKYQAKDPRGMRPYHPRMMVGLLLYGYSVGVRSSRELEKATYEDVPFRVLTADSHPDHTRISEFRRKHLDELEEIFVQVCQICQRAGLVELGEVALDGSKIQGNASKHKAMSYKRMKQEEKRLKDEIQQMLQEAETVDEREDERYGRDNRGDGLPDELADKRRRLETIQQAKADLEAEAKQGRAEDVEAKAERAKDRAEHHETKGTRRRAATMADKWSDKAERLYEEVDSEVIDATTPDGLPTHRPRVNADGIPKPKAQRNFTDPDSRIVKKGDHFMQGYNCQIAVDGAHQIIVAQSMTNNASDVGCFGPMVDKTVDNMEAAPDRVLADSGYWQPTAPEGATKHDAEAFISTGEPPSGDKSPTDRPPPDDDADAVAKMRHKLKTEDGLDAYSRRKTIVEPVFGHIKEVGGFRRFQLRGFDKVRKEWALVCTAHNLNKLHRHLPSAGSLG